VDDGATGTSSGSPAFDSLRAALTSTPELLGEVEGALRLLVDRVDPAGRGARFVVGAAAEWIIAAAAWSSGVLTLPGGHDVNGFDLVDLSERMRGLWSVKSSFQPKPAAFRISNGMGGVGAGLVDPTVFLHPRLPGLVFVDPVAHADVARLARPTGDAVVLAFTPVAEHAERRPECVAPVRVAANSHRGREDPALSFTKGLLNESQFPRLADLFIAATPSGAPTVAEEIRSMARLHASGQLSDEQFEAVKNRLLLG
jgi:hypothetical protein